jgi:DNA-binding transcriptional MerR regulator
MAMSVIHADDSLLFTSDVARILGVSEATVRLWHGLGKLTAITTHRGVRVFQRETVEQLARARHQATVSIDQEVA